MKQGLLVLSMLSLAAYAGEHGGKKMEHGGQKVEGESTTAPGDTAEAGGEMMGEGCGEMKDKKDHKACMEKMKGKKGSGKKPAAKEEAAPGKADQGQVMPQPKNQVTVEQIKAALTEYIAQHTDASGIYSYIDVDRNNQPMKLKFVKIHDPVRFMEKKGQYFACTDFEVTGESGKLHDLDFWMVPTATGLEVVSTKVHKDPVKKAKAWVKVPRYTFEGEEMVGVN
ncbi:MAG: hypothetical protein IT288_11360 [Bdellovibrionales bacterium]|nr:hypothetical protein [Bdellovibrionales bacterium]